MMNEQGVNLFGEITRPRPGLYLCKRQSLWDGGKPCEEAFKIKLPVIDTRSCDDPKKIPANNGTDGDWYALGTNHRLVNGEIQRDLGVASYWAVELPTLADLTAFVQRYGECIIRPSNLRLFLNEGLDGFFEIVIFDDYP